MDIGELTINQAREIAALMAGEQTPPRWGPQVGSKVFIRTVTFFYVGEVEAVSAFGIHLIRAAWIPQTGRFHEAMRTGDLDEVEPYPDAMKVMVAMGAIVDMCSWPHPLPREAR
jgi:hypothetical protein